MASASSSEVGAAKRATPAVVRVAAGFDAADLIVTALIALLLLAAFVLHVYWFIPNHDNEWYLIATARMLAGGHYVTDFMEPNPPLIMLLMVPAVALARVTSIEPYAAFTLYVCLLIALSVRLAAPAVRWLFAADLTGSRLALIIYAAILCISPAYQFGQREHLFVILFSPGLFWFAAREGGRRSPSGSAPAAIGLAAVAVLIKPFYLLVPVCLLVSRVIRHRDRRLVIDAPVCIFIAVTLAYAVVILLMFPAYLTEAAIQRQVYFAWDRTWLTVLDASRDAAIVLGLAILLTELAPAAPAVRWFLRVLTISAAACLLLGIAQKKGWPYQLLPTVEIAGSALVFRLLTLRSRLSQRRDRVRSAAVFAAIVIQLPFLAVGPWRETTTLTRARFRGEPLLATLRHIATGKSVLLLTSGYQMGFPSMTDARLAGRAPSQVLLPGIVRLADGTRSQRRRADALRQLAVHELVNDLDHDRPDFVAVDRRRVKQALPDGFRILRFYGSDPSFVAAWRGYRLDRSIPGWDIYARGLPDAAGPNKGPAP